MGNDDPGRSAEKLSQEYATAGKTSTFEALRVFLDPNSSIAAPTYDEVASRLELSIGDVKTLLHRLRKRYTALLRAEVSRTVSDPAEIDEEIHALCDDFGCSRRAIRPMKTEDRHLCPS